MVSRFFPLAAAAAVVFVPLTAYAADMNKGSDHTVASHMDNGAIHVTMNQAKVIKLSREAGTVIVGNPEIADATVRDATTIILTGLDFGRTNMVILDTSGQPIIDEMITVARDTNKLVTVYRRSDVQALSCEPVCERAYLNDAEKESVRDASTANN